MRVLIALCLTLLLAGCSRGWEDTNPTSAAGGTGIMRSGEIAEGENAISSVSQLPAHGANGAVEPFGSKGVAAAYEFGTGYKVGAGDRIAVRVAGEADLTSEYLVDGAGTISMPYIQTITIAGLTAPEIENLVAGKLRQGYLRDPQVSVQVSSLRPFYILGEVNTSGSFSYQPGITVQNAIAIAGGYSARADQDKVLITRKNSDGTKTYKVPVTTQIYPGDIIYVRERWF